MGCPHIHEPLSLWILPDLMDNPEGLTTGPWTTLRVAHKFHSLTTRFFFLLEDDEKAFPDTLSPAYLSGKDLLR
jgi:hypothetical protein